MAALTADCILFNSDWCRRSFLENIPKHLKMIPNNRPPAKAIAAKIEEKSTVVYFPVKKWPKSDSSTEKVHVIWAHRWEHDKNPELLFSALEKIKDEDFVLSVVGQAYSQIPESFTRGKEALAEKIVNWGFLPSREDYQNVMDSADIAISTANHEFFGVTMVEAALTRCVCYGILS